MRTPLPPHRTLKIAWHHLANGQYDPKSDFYYFVPRHSWTPHTLAQFTTLQNS